MFLNLLSMLKTVVLLIFVETVILFSGFLESSKEQHLYKMEILCVMFLRLLLIHVKE